MGSWYFSHLALLSEECHWAFVVQQHCLGSQVLWSFELIDNHHNKRKLDHNKHYFFTRLLIDYSC